MDEWITLQFDGGSRGNPGPAAVGVVLRAADGTTLRALGKPIGRATNNAAEYRALITGLEEAKRLGVKKLIIRGDSELIIKQMRGEYKIKNAGLQPLAARARLLAMELDEVIFEHVRRELNKEADRLSNLAMDMAEAASQ